VIVNAPPFIETTRLVLTTPTLDDAQEVFDRYASDPDVTRYLGWPRHRSVSDTEAFLAFSEAEWERSRAGPYLVYSRDNGRLLGGTGLSLDSDTLASTGYVLAKDAWGQGYATEALAAMVDLAADLKVTTLYALCHPGHRASQRVLEKCGFDRDESWHRQLVFPNLVPGVQQDVFCYVRSL
jgi:RimJ/RimL family protein N-acetyltransferase